MGFGVRGLWSGVWGLGSGVWGLGSGVWGLELHVARGLARPTIPCAAPSHPPGFDCPNDFAPGFDFVQALRFDFVRV